MTCDLVMFHGVRCSYCYIVYFRKLIWREINHLISAIDIRNAQGQKKNHRLNNLGIRLRKFDRTEWWIDIRKY